MNIIEAVKSGKPFKRPHHSKFYKLLDDCYSYGSDEKSIHLCEDKYDNFYNALHTEDLLAEDWETKDE